MQWQEMNTFQDIYFISREIKKKMTWVTRYFSNFFSFCYYKIVYYLSESNNNLKNIVYNFHNKLFELQVEVIFMYMHLINFIPRSILSAR